MKILWITNVLFPEAVSLLTGNPSRLNGSGGWLVSASEEIISEGEINLVVVAPSNIVKKMTKVEGKHITYYAMPCRDEHKYDPSFEGFWKEIVIVEKPALVHIHGTEFSHGLAFLRAKTNIPTVLSIQGLSEEIGKHFLDGMSLKDVYCNLSLFDFFHTGSLVKQQKRFIKHGQMVEREMIQSVKFIIGRTSFDYSHVMTLNPKAIYYSCNESLRQEFYDGNVWEYDRCQKHTIFISQSTYPIKGLHQLLKSMPYVLSNYPDAHIRIAGRDILDTKTFKNRLLRSSFANYIKSLIKENGLKNSVTFTGPLDAKQMRDEYLKCNVFVCPSSIENSPNSVGEAQILGVPCVASFVGGTPDMVSNNKCGLLYHFSDVIMLAYAICRVFSSEWHSEEERAVAAARHDRVKNLKNLLSIYNTIIDK